MKKTAVKIMVVVLVLSSLFILITGCKKKSSYQNWKESLVEYDKWADDYIAFMKKYNANPSDPSLLSDYTKMYAQYSNWAIKFAKIQEDEELTDEEEAEISKEYSRITLKLAAGVGKAVGK